MFGDQVYVLQRKQGRHGSVVNQPISSFMFQRCLPKLAVLKQSYTFQIFDVIKTIVFSFEAKTMYLSFNNFNSVHIIVFPWENNYYTKWLTLSSISLFSKVYIFNFLFSFILSSENLCLNNSHLFWCL